MFFEALESTELTEATPAYAEAVDLLNHTPSLACEKNKSGDTPLHIAAFGELGEKLIAAGGDINAKGNCGATAPPLRSI